MLQQYYVALATLSQRQRQSSKNQRNVTWEQGFPENSWYDVVDGRRKSYARYRYVEKVADRSCFVLLKILDTSAGGPSIALLAANTRSLAGCKLHSGLLAANMQSLAWLWLNNTFPMKNLHNEL